MKALFLLALPGVVAAQQGPAVKIVVTPAAPRVVAGDTLRLTARAVDARGQTVPGVTIRFQQSAAQFEGTVDETGLVTAGAPSTIPVVVAGIVGTGTSPLVQKINIEVLPGPAASISIDRKSAKLLVGQTLVLRGLSFSKTGDPRKDQLAWSSSANGVVSASNDGTIRGIAPGRAIITAAVGAIRSTITVDVVSANVSSLSVSPSTGKGRAGDVIHFALSAKDANGQEITGLAPTWLIAPGKGEIGSDGAFVGYDAGTYVVSASLGTRSAQAQVTLTPRDVRRPATVVSSVVRSAFPTSEVWVHPNGRVAYLGTHLGGDRVYVLDVSDPADPKIVDSVIVNARVINDMMTTRTARSSSSRAKARRPQERHRHLPRSRIRCIRRSSASSPRA